jgi:hypothetical protein
MSGKKAKMSRIRSVTIKAAIITGIFAILAAVIGAFALFIKQDRRPVVTARSEGDSSAAVAIGGDVRESQIIVKPPSSKQEGITGEVRVIVNEILNVIDSVASSSALGPDNGLDSMFSKDLARNPYNVRALILRGQWYYVTARTSGGKGLREALQDFEKASSVDKELADPHFGIGTVLYYIGIFDLVQRGLFQIHKKGAIRMNKDTGLLEIQHPSFELFPDRRSKAVFQAALDEFQMGHRLRQIYERGNGGTVVFFAPRDVENRIRSLRGLLGHEPVIAPDTELVMALSSFLSAVEPGGFERLLELKPD